jgi:hypothetical protein
MTLEGLRIARVGSFYAGGRQIEVSGHDTQTIAFTRSTSFTYDPNGLYHVEQAYVQYFIPERLVSPLPVVLLHGGGFSGAMWDHAGWTPRLAPISAQPWLFSVRRRQCGTGSGGLVRCPESLVRRPHCQECTGGMEPLQVRPGR